MDNQIATVMAEFDARAEHEAELFRTLPPEEGMARRDEWLIHIGEAAGRLLNLLIRESGARHIVEVGTAYGYSTLWLAEAARANGGRVITLEVHSGKQEHARQAIKRAGLDAVVEWRLGDALETLGQLEQPFDFVLLDIWKELYIPCFDLIWPKLAPGGMLAADNMRQPVQYRQDAEAYRRHIRQRSDIQTLLLPVGSGIELSRKNEAA